MVSFKIYDTCRWIERGSEDNVAGKSKAALFRAILETGWRMLPTMDLADSNNVEHSSAEQELEIRIIGVWKGLENVVVGRVFDL
jgi:hypothetical protein